MKRLIFLADAPALIRLLAIATGEENNAEVKHLFIPSVNGNRGASVSGLDIERGVDYPSVVHLKGNVEIQMPVCLRTAPGNPMICNGDMIVRADTADMQEDTARLRRMALSR